MAAHPSPQPDPALILETCTMYQIPLALKGAVELDLFTEIAQGANTPALLANACNASERGVRILCDYLTIHGFLTKKGSAYGLTPTAAAFLVKTSPAYMGSVTNFLLHDMMFTNFRDVAALVRKGGAVGHSTTTPEDPIWVEFARSMAPMMMLPAQLAAAQITQPGEPVKVLDIAAGHGIYGISVARHNPDAQVTFQDWANVLQVARENTQKMSVADQAQFIEGSAFDVDFGTGYDIIMLPNFLHHFDEPTCVTLLKKVRAALKPGDIVATIEFVPNEDRISPPMAAGFSLMMLGGTEAGDAYTYNDLEGMFRAAGFGTTDVRPLSPAPSTLLITEYA